MKKLKDQIGTIMIILALLGAGGTYFTSFAKLSEQVKVLKEASKSIDVASLDVVKENSQDIATNTFTLNDHQTAIAILKKEIQLLDLQFKELKISSSNPLQ